jgi:hypothetical protein
VVSIFESRVPSMIISFGCIIMAGIIAGFGQTAASFMVAVVFLLPLLLTGHRVFYPRTIVSLNETKLAVYDFKTRKCIEVPKAEVRSALIEDTFRPDGEGWGSVRVLKVLAEGQSLNIVLPMLNVAVEDANARLREWIDQPNQPLKTPPPR